MPFGYIPNGIVRFLKLLILKLLEKEPGSVVASPVDVKANLFLPSLNFGNRIAEDI